VLEGLPSIEAAYRVFRYEADQSDSNFATNQGLSAQELAEFRIAAPDRSVPIKNPFRSRFSDGTFCVKYTSLELATAETEVRHWLPQRAAGTRTPTQFHYSADSYQFSGITKDLRSMSGTWPGLTHPTDYGFCTQLGKEAIAHGLDSLVTPSARRVEGSNLPVFRAPSLTFQSSTGTLVLTFPQPKAAPVDA
jgi:RES domain